MIVPQKPTCYLSYCWKSEIYPFLQRLKLEIEKHSQNRIFVILDKRNFSIGDNFMEKEKQILESDLVVAFFTPEYKKRVDEYITNSGVFREYGYILKLRENNNDSYVYPILLRGEKSHSIPREFKDNVYDTLISSIRYKEGGKKYIIIENTSKNKLHNLVKGIIGKTIRNHTLGEIRYKNLSEKYQSLLKNTAADGSLRKACMIKMPAYSDVFDQTSYFVIGRKGSGKSTLLETIEKLEPDEFELKYKTLCPIKAEHIDIASIYSLTVLLRSDQNDIPVRNITDLFWEVFFIVQSIFVVSLEIESGKISRDDNRYHIFNKMRNFLRKRLGVNADTHIEETNVKKQLASFVTEIMSNYIKNNILDKADEISFITSIKVNMNPLNMVETFFEKNLFRKFVEAVSKCEKKILISLDGFDDHSEDFRRVTRSLRDTDRNESEARETFENLFYRSLTDIVKKFKKERYNSILDAITENINFCIVLPQDRLDQIKHIDRDISKTKCCGLFWDAFDLLKMLVLRLESYYGYNTPFQNNNLRERFHNILRDNLPKIPVTVKIVVAGREHDFDLFNYMLMLSFWRPRDILLHFISLLELVENSNEVGLDIDDRMIKDALSQSARKIIDEEFIQEYQNVFYNLRDVLNKFRGYENIMPINEFFNIISTIKFDASFSYDCKNLKNRILILYQLGVIGLRFERDTIAHRGYTHHICFYFNEGLSPIYDVVIDRGTIATDAEIIINPLFCKAFSIKICTSELLCNYDWNYIQRLSIEKRSKRRF
jgi:energy-coupling factor transporter ATP-binding protein EcfA2